WAAAWVVSETRVAASALVQSRQPEPASVLARSASVAASASARSASVAALVLARSASVAALALVLVPVWRLGHSDEPAQRAALKRVMATTTWAIEPARQFEVAASAPAVAQAQPVGWAACAAPRAIPAPA